LTAPPRIGRKVTLFELAFAQSPTTKSSIASLFISKFPSQHKLIYNKHKLPSSYTTLAEALKLSGYATATFIENPMIGEQFGFAQGFDNWVSDVRRHKPGKQHWGEGERRRAAEKIDNFDEEIFSWMETHRDGDGAAGYAVGRDDRP
jgi:arylsulfatase A-like enzyme